jgi:lipopolysaccharide transport system ATP-binding protein
MKPIIRVTNLSKEYRIGTVQPPYQTLRESFTTAVRLPFGRQRRASQPRYETIWALKDVNFEIAPGEVVGIIGRNGAGKSTLLKILSRVTEPTTGRVELYGRIGSLLEVGTGFHPELTGRENVFLNGAILGMRRREIERKFDEIVAFSEIERFIDTPVKWYSSGMYLRLAFSVSAHLEPEILILDEVLAVGDTSFQQKCLNKMTELRKDGRTIIFVSHSMQSVTRLCERAMYLSEGTVVDDGQSQEVATGYLGSQIKIEAERTWANPAKAPGNEIARLCAVRVRTESGEVRNTLDIRRPVAVEMEFEVLEEGHVLVPNYQFANEEGICVFATANHDPVWHRRPRPLGRYTSTVWIPGNFLSEGTLLVGPAVSTMVPVKVHFFEPAAIAFQIVDTLDGDSVRGDYTGPMPGVVRPLLSWTTEFHSPSNSEPKRRSELAEAGATRPS